MATRAKKRKNQKVRQQKRERKERKRRRKSAKQALPTIPLLDGPFADDDYDWDDADEEVMPDPVRAAKLLRRRD